MQRIASCTEAMFAQDWAQFYVTCDIIEVTYDIRAETMSSKMLTKKGNLRQSASAQEFTEATHFHPMRAHKGTQTHAHI